jgi:hypothetical protein
MEFPSSTIPKLLELPRRLSIIYNRLKYGCSSLNAHLAESNIIPDATCACRLGAETLFHFMYDCPFYDVQREKLMFELIDLGLMDLSLAALFHCDMTIANDLIFSVQNLVFKYIQSTRRFT